MCPTGGCGVAPAWAVPTTERFYKPLGIWFLGSIKHLEGKKILEIFPKTLLESISERLRVPLSFISFLRFLLLSFNPTQELQLCCVKEKEGESYSVSKCKSKMYNLHISVVPCPTWRSKLGRNSKARVFGRKELNAYIELFIQYIFRWFIVFLRKLTFHSEYAQVGSCLWHPHAIPCRKRCP